MLNRLIKSNNAGGGGCTNIVDNYDPFGGNGVALYQLNGNANDVSGNYNGTASNVTYGTGVFGQAGVFNGSSSIITNSNQVIPNGASSISFWYNNNGLNGTNFIIGNGVATASKGITAIFSSNRFETFIGKGTTAAAIQFSSTNTFSNSSWHNFTITWDGTTSTNAVKLYVNGQFEGQGTSNTSSASIGSYSSFGIGGVNGGGYAAGSIDQVRIFNTALDPLEIEALYTEELCICDGTVDTLDILGDGSCIATYPLDGNANDLSGNYSGTPIDVSYGVGEFDLAAVFTDPNTRKIDLPSSLNANVFNPTGQFSLSMWIKMNDITRPQYLFNCNTPNNVNLGVDSNNQGNGKVVWTIYNASYSYLISTTTITTGVWYNIVVTYNNGLSEMFIDNVSQGTITKTIVQSSEKVTLGYRENLPLTEGANGSIDQVRIFNKALNSTEVTTLYNETACAKVCTSGTTNTLDILGDGSCIATYPLDGSPADLSGNYNGVQTNVTYPVGEFDLAASFNGSSSYISSATTNAFNLQTFTVSVWAKLNSFDANPVIVSNSGTSETPSGTGWNVAYYNSNNAFYFGNNGVNLTFTTTPILTNVWYHIVATVDLTSNKIKIFLNGVFENENTYNGISYNSGTRSLRIGKVGYYDELYWNGSIDQVRIFNKALSAGEVTTLYNETPCN